MFRTIYPLLQTNHFKYHKLLFLTGPRQVGKTTLAKQFLEEKGTPQLYYNWDDREIKKRMNSSPYDFEKDIPIKLKKPLIVFDEIHRQPRWKDYLKGVYDRFHPQIDFLVTGSGRLNVYKKGTDSLLGRYFLYNLFPLTVGEVLKNPIQSFKKIFKKFDKPQKISREIFDQLMKFSGFPEPFLKANASFLLRWEKNRKELILRQDVRDLTNVREIGLMEYLITLLPIKIGSPLSLNSLCGDVGVSFKTIQNWMEILEGVYYLFSLKPYSAKISRAIKKEKKIYFWNWREIEDLPSRFENLIACHLQKTVSTINDFGLGNWDIAYCRDKQGREVDFLLLKDNQPWKLIEVKWSDENPSSALLAFMKMLGIDESFQVIQTPGIHYVKKYPIGRVHIISAEIFLAELI